MNTIYNKFLFILFIIFTCYSYTQNNADSLNYKITDLQKKGKYLSSNELLLKLIHITPLDSLEKRIRIYYDIGYNYQNARVSDSSYFYYKKGDYLFSSNMTELVWSERYHNWGSYFFSKSQIDSSMVNLLMALDYANKSKNSNQILNVNLSLGELFLAQNSFQKANKYFESSLKIATSLNDIFWMNVIKMYLGRLQYEQKNYDEAENLLTGVLTYFNSQDHNRYKLICHGYLAKIYLDTSQGDKAYYNALQTMPLLKEMELKNDAELLTNNTIKINEIAQKEEINNGDKLKADSLIQQNLNITKEPKVKAKQIKALLKQEKIKDTSISRKSLKVLDQKNLSKMYDEALNVKDSLYQTSLDSKYIELETKYRTEIKEKEILVLKNENYQKELKIAKETKKSLWLTLFLVLLLIFIVFIYLYVKTRKRKLLWNNKLAIAKAVQEEHNQIGIDLHDSKAKQLEIIALQLKEKGEDNMSSKIENIRKDIRQLSHELSEVSFEDSEFDKQLVNTAIFYQNNNFKIEFIGLNKIHWKSYNKTIKRNLFIILREAISNAHRHSKASELKINFSQIKNKLHLEISDNGIGLAEYNDSRTRGFKNIKIRVNEINGSVTFKSLKNKGLNITIILALA